MKTSKSIYPVEKHKSNNKIQKYPKGKITLPYGYSKVSPLESSQPQIITDHCGRQNNLECVVCLPHVGHKRHGGFCLSFLGSLWGRPGTVLWRHSSNPTERPRCQGIESSVNTTWTSYPGGESLKLQSNLQTAVPWAKFLNISSPLHLNGFCSKNVFKSPICSKVQKR